MKKKLLIIFASAGTIIQSGAFAGDLQDKAGTQSTDSLQSPSASAEMSHLQTATSLIGTDVRNQQDEKLGDIKDVMVDLQSGRAPFAVISSGGFFGVGDRLLAVPTTSFKSSSTQDQLLLGMDSSQLKSAPSFDKNSWPNMNDETWSSGVYTYYDAKPMSDSVALDNSTEINEAAGADRSSIPGRSDWTSQSFGETTTGLSRDRTPRQGLGAEDLTMNQQKIYNPGGYAESEAFFHDPAGAERTDNSSALNERRTQRKDANTLQATQTGKIKRASELIGMEVKNAQNERIGEIKDVVLDLQSGRVAYTVLNPDHSLAANDKLFAVPPAVFTRSSDDKWLVFNTDKQTLMTAPSFDMNNWEQSNNAKFTSEVYRFYHQQPYWNGQRDIREPAGSQPQDYRNDSDQLNKGEQGSSEPNPAAEPAGAQPSTSASTEDPATEPRNEVEPERNEAPADATPGKEYKGESDSSADKETAESKSEEEQKSVQQEPAGAANSTAPATSEDQSANDSDRRMSQQLRTTLQNDGTIANTSKSVMVSTVKGRITLRGTVASEQEKQSIASKAQMIAGSADKVDNQLKIKGDATPTPNP